MGLLGEIVGVVVAEEGLKKVDPNAGIIEKGAAAIAGWKGAEAIEEHFEQKKEEEKSE